MYVGFFIIGVLMANLIYGLASGSALRANKNETRDKDEF